MPKTSKKKGMSQKEIDELVAREEAARELAEAAKEKIQKASEEIQEICKKYGVTLVVEAPQLIQIAQAMAPAVNAAGISLRVLPEEKDN